MVASQQNYVSLSNLGGIGELNAGTDITGIQEASSLSSAPLTGQVGGKRKQKSNRKAKSKKRKVRRTRRSKGRRTKHCKCKVCRCKTCKCNKKRSRMTKRR